MAAVTTGAKIVLRTATARVVLRSLGTARLEGTWSVPVLGDATHAHGIGRAQVPGTTGTVEVDAEITLDDGRLVLRNPRPHPCHAPHDPCTADASAAHDPGRRAHRRTPAGLSLRGALVTGPAVGNDEEIALHGHTLDVSAGGLSALVHTRSPFGPVAARARAPRPARRPDPSLTVPVGAQVYVEIDLPDGRRVPALAEVVEHDAGVMRARFVEIDDADRRRLDDLDPSGPGPRSLRHR